MPHTNYVPTKGPDFFSISYLQGRPIRLARNVPESVQILKQIGFKVSPLDYFFDLQVNRRHHIARVRLDDVKLVVPGKNGDTAFVASGSLHVLLWSVGFMIFRLTFTDSGMHRPNDNFKDWFKGMHALEHDFDIDFSSKSNPIWTATVADAKMHAVGGARRFFDVVGNAIHESLQGRKPQPELLTRWASSNETALDHAEELVASGELRYPHPVTFGTHSELIWRESHGRPRDLSTWIQGFIGSGMEGQLIAANVDEQISHKDWYISEFQSIFIGTSDVLPDGSDVHDLTRAEMMEYITYRRVGLMAIQRETQQITAERSPIEGARVADWMWLLSAVTNDYVLGGWAATMFERFRQRYLSFEGVRNLFGLEAQVTSNIEAFQGRLDAESDRIGVVTGVLFGIVAATALVPLGELLVMFLFHLNRNSYANFPDVYPLAFVGIVVGMLVLVGGICWQLLKHSSSLRPPSSLGGQRKTGIVRHYGRRFRS